MLTELKMFKKLIALMKLTSKKKQDGIKSLQRHQRSLLSTLSFNPVVEVIIRKTTIMMSERMLKDGRNSWILKLNQQTTRRLCLWRNRVKKLHISWTKYESIRKSIIFWSSKMRKMENTITKLKNEH